MLKAIWIVIVAIVLLLSIVALFRPKTLWKMSPMSYLSRQSPDDPPRYANIAARIISVVAIAVAVFLLILGLRSSS